MYKIINLIQEDTVAGSVFWENIGVDVGGEKWQDVVNREAGIAKPYGDLTREALRR